MASSELISDSSISQKAMSNIVDLAGPLTETILLGNLAVYKAREPGQKARVDWDAKSLSPKGDSALMAIVKPPFRDGYVL